MRNLKKLLALVLAMVMAFSLMLSASAANGDYDKYTDKETITEEFQTAVNVLSGLDVLKGDGPDDAKTFRPADTLTRAEAAVIVYRVATGDVKDQQTELYKDYATFKDMSHDDWFAGYVGFCQNAGYIKGTSPTTFSPYEKVSGYQLLAMLLRVIGYGKNNEFTGNTWMVNTAALAEQLHITDTVKAANFANTLKENARRDVVAELTFRTINDVYTVTYTPALGYSDSTNQLTGGNWKNDTQAYKIFKLHNKPVVQEDTWGRPNDTWFCDSVKGVAHQYDKTVDTVVAAITWKPVAEYNTAKTECDIIHENADWSKDKDQTITSAYINGVARGRDAKWTQAQDGGAANATIEALGTRNVIGAQGRILEIYDMSKSYNYGQPNAETGARIVEIDTWLGQVAKVTAAGTDKNGHPTKATIDVDVFPGGDDVNGRVHSEVTGRDGCTTGHIWDFNGVEAEGFSAGDYVLVYINQNTSDKTHNPTSFVTNKWSIANNASATKKVLDGQDNIVKAEIKAGGYVQTWTNTVETSDKPDTTTIGTTVYNDAAKFCANWRNTNKTWSVAVDRYGNAIGLVSINSYLAIEKLEWKHGTGFGDDFALANVLTAGGERVEGVKIRDVNNLATQNASGATTGDGDGVGTLDPAAKKVLVSDYYTNNKQFYQHIYEYAVNEDGTYSLRTTPADPEAQVKANTANGIYGGFTYWGSNPDTDDDTSNGWTATADGHYTAGNDVIDLDGADVTRGESTIWGDMNGTTNKVVATNSTVFAYLNADGYTYTVYTGKDNAPSATDAHICAQIGANGYAAFVLVKGHLTTDSSTFWGFLASDRVATTKWIGGQLCNGYNVYRLGETTPTIVYTSRSESIVDTTGDNGTFENYGVGFYEMTIDGNGQLIDKTDRTSGGPGADIIHKMTMKYLTNPYSGTVAGNNGNLGGVDVPIVGETYQRKMDTVAVATRYVDGSFMGAKYSMRTDYDVNPLSENGYSLKTGITLAPAVKDYSVTSDTKVIVVGMSISAFTGSVINANDNRSDPNEKYGPATVTEGTVEDIRGDAVVWVDYTTTTRNGRPVHTANNVYVLKLPNDYTLYKKVDTNATLSVEGAVIANGMPGFQTLNMNADARTAALNAAKAAPYEVSLTDLQGRIGSVATGWNFSIGLIAGDASLKLGNTLVTQTGDQIDYYTGTATMTAPTGLDGDYNWQTGKLAISENDQFLITWQIGPDAGPGYYVYTVVKITK